MKRTKNKLLRNIFFVQTRRQHPDSPLVLVGWGVSSAVNCQVAAMESVDALVCLGFPMATLDGARGEQDDPIMELKTPVQFIVGQNATTSRSEFC